MKAKIAILFLAWMLAAAPGYVTAQSHGGKDAGYSAEHAAPAKEKKGHESHGKTDSGFKHEAVSEGIRARFQVMTLASMNMTDPEGHTHHVMVTLSEDGSGRQFKDAVGKIKIIGPSKKETVSDLKDYSGILAANFTADAPGKYGIICLFKVGDKKPLYKFWYVHG